MDDTVSTQRGLIEESQPVRRDAEHDAASAIGQQTAAAADQAKRQANSLLEQARDKVLTFASNQKDGIAGQLDELAQTVHKAGEPFAGQQEWIAEAIERGAAELGSLAGSLRDNDIGALTRQVRALAQRQPVLFAGLCLAGGLALARVGKLVAADVSREDLPSLSEVGHGAR